MAVYHKINQAVTNETELITLIRTVLTHANVGMVESSWTTGRSDHILLKTKNQHNGNEAYLHFINRDGAPHYLELHAYPPNHEAFDAPDSFDAPDANYLPHPDGDGGSYVVANEYYSATGNQEHRIAYTYNTTVDIFSDGDFVLLYIASGDTNSKWLYGKLFTQRQLDFGWLQMSAGTTGRSSVKNGATIRKGSPYLYTLSIQSGILWGGITAAFITGLDTSPASFLLAVYFQIVEASYDEVLDLEQVLRCDDAESRGAELIYGGETYYVVVAGSVAGMGGGCAILKGTAL